MKTYSLHIVQLILAFGVLGVMTWAAIFLVIPYFFITLFRNISDPSWVFALFWLTGVSAAWFMFLNMPYKIVITGDQIYFKSFISYKILMFYELKAIRTTGFRGGFISIHYMGGTLFLISTFPKFREFLSIVESENPRVIITGL